MPNFGTARCSRAVIGLALVVGFAAPAFASPQIDVIAESQHSRTQRMQVRYSDLDLAGARGMRTLNNRIALAAAQVCSGDALYTIDARSDYLTCRHNAMSDAQSQIQQRIARDGGAPLTFSVG